MPGIFGLDRDTLIVVEHLEALLTRNCALLAVQNIIDELLLVYNSVFAECIGSRYYLTVTHWSMWCITGLLHIADGPCPNMINLKSLYLRIVLAVHSTRDPAAPARQVKSIRDFHCP